MDVRTWIVFLTDYFQRSLCTHGKIDRRLVHVDDETPVATAAVDDEVHESHEVGGLALNFGWRALGRVRAHSIGVQMGKQEALHAAAAHCEAHCAELGRDPRSPQHDGKRVDRDALLA